MTNRPKPAGYTARRRRRGVPPQRFALRGAFRLEVVGADGRTKDVREVRNMIVNAGLDFVKELLLDSVSPTALATMTHIAIGTDATPETPADVALGVEAARRAFDNYTAGGTGIATVDVTFPAATGPLAVTEAAVFDGAGPGGNMLNRATFTAVNITITDTLKVAFTFTITDA